LSENFSPETEFLKNGSLDEDEEKDLDEGEDGGADGQAEPAADLGCGKQSHRSEVHRSKECILNEGLAETSRVCRLHLIKFDVQFNIKIYLVQSTASLLSKIFLKS
jgi:hypothetical protein